jgi:ABC-type multidrug transport system ATPase subunit
MTSAAVGATSGIALAGIAKTYRSAEGPVHAVRGIDVSIAAGETVALLGPNGAGKSTTIDMLLGLARPDASSVSVFGRTPAEAVAAGAVGAMLQTGELIRNLDVRELIAMVASLYPSPLDVEETIELCGIGAIGGRRTQKLSGGQTQRVRFAIALVADPELLVLDEPTVAMDVEGRRGFWETMRAFAARGKTVIFATHYLEEADAYADRAVLMAQGADRRRRPDDGDQGTRRLAHDPRDASRAYLRAKVLTAYLMALLSIVALYVAGAAMGVRIPAGRWLDMTALILIGLIPFAALGILLGHLLTVDAIGPAMGGGIALLAFLGGTWFPIADRGVLHVVGQALPSYWIVQAGHVALGGRAWGSTAGSSSVRGRSCSRGSRCAPTSATPRACSAAPFTALDGAGSISGGRPVPPLAPCRP